MRQNKGPQGVVGVADAILCVAASIVALRYFCSVPVLSRAVKVGKGRRRRAFIVTAHGCHFTLHVIQL